LFPDTRIEYRDEESSGATAGGGSVDIAVVKSKFNSSLVRRKAAVGFRIYRMQADGSLGGDSP